jgi:hypothetical protein
METPGLITVWMKYVRMGMKVSALTYEERGSIAELLRRRDAVNDRLGRRPGYRGNVQEIRKAGAR